LFSFFVLFRVFYHNATLTPPRTKAQSQPPDRDGGRHDARTIHRIAPTALAERDCAGFPQDIEAACSL